VQQRLIQTSQEMAKQSHGKDGKTKDVFPLSHGTATAIDLNLFAIFVAPGL
jgi:hypothetical protein